MSDVCPRCATRLDAPVHGLCPRCLLDFALAGDDDAGEDLPFRIVTLLGRGPHGTTYLAEQDHEPRFVSLKVLEGEAARAARPHLAAVCRALLDCRHPSLVHIVHVGAGADPSVAAAYLRGRRAQAGRDDVVAGLRDVAAALAYLHDRGIAHGNVHASNVIAIPDPTLTRQAWCLIDLAAARPIADGAAADVCAFGQLMRDVLGDADAGGALRGLVERTGVSGTRMSDIAGALSAL